jgi:hypothetical protein
MRNNRFVRASDGLIDAGIGFVYTGNTRSMQKIVDKPWVISVKAVWQSVGGLLLIWVEAWDNRAELYSPSAGFQF